MTIHTAQLNSVQQVSCLHDADKRTFGFSGQSVQLPTDLGSLVTQEVREVRKFVCSQVKIAPVAVILLQTISVMSYFNYLVVGAGRYEHIMTALRDVLHWLPVPQRIQFKIAISAFDCVREHCPVTSASQSPAFVVRVRQNATTCLSLRQEHSSADGVSTLQPQPSGTRFHHSCTHHPLVVDSLELSWVENPSLHTGLQTDTSENFCWKAYRFTFTLFDWIFMIYAMMVTDCRLCLCAPEINFNACKLINDTTRHETELTVQPSSAHNVALSSWKPFKKTLF